MYLKLINIFTIKLISYIQVNKYDNIIDCYGITQDPVTKEYMLIIKYAKDGNLHDYLQKEFVNITWNNKIFILWKISKGYLYFNV
jgi:hypothetical protein